MFSVSSFTSLGLPHPHGVLRIGWATHLYVLSFAHSYAFIPPFVRSHTPPFLRIRTHHCPPHISCGLLTFVHPASTFHALPVVCHRGLFVRIQALSNAQLNLRGSYALPRGHRTSERTLRFVCSPAALRHVMMHRECPYWCACDGRCGQQGELVEGQRSACPSAKEWEAGCTAGVVVLCCCSRRRWRC